MHCLRTVAHVEAMTDRTRTLAFGSGRLLGGVRDAARDEQQAFVRELDALSLADSKQQACARRAERERRLQAIPIARSAADRLWSAPLVAWKAALWSSRALNVGAGLLFSFGARRIEALPLHVARVRGVE